MALEQTVARGPAALAGPAPLAPLRIAFLSYRSDPKVGGQGGYLAQAAAALAGLGHKVDVISGPPFPLLSDGVRLIELPSLDLYAKPHHGHYALRPQHFLSWTDLGEYFGHLSGKFTEPWSFGRRASAYLRAHRGDYDVVLDNQSLCSGLIAIQALGLPVVGVVHHPVRRDLELALAAESDKGKRWLIERWYSFLAMQERVAPQLSDIIVVSDHSKKDVVACLKVRPEAITSIPLGIDLDMFRATPETPRRMNEILAVVSADVPLKGLRYLVEAYDLLLKSHPGLDLTVIGRLRDGPTSELIAERGLGGRIRFRADLTRAEIAQAYAQATICVTPSLYEGFGLPAAEALSCGAPVIVTDGGALPEVVGSAGIVVPKADAGALADAIDALLRDPKRREAMGRAASAWAVKRFDWQRSAQAYEIVLRRAMARAC